MDHELTSILLADDDQDDQELLREAFREVVPQVKVDAVSFGKDVLAYLHKCADDQLPRLILLDYNMPDMNGAEVLQQLCLHTRFKDIPTVVWSTSNAFLYKEVCKRNGAKEYFQKPHRYDELVALCRKLFEMTN